MTITAFGTTYPVASEEDARAARAYRNARYRDLINTDAEELPTPELNALLSGIPVQEVSA